MRIVFLMAIKTILRSVLQVSWRTCARMAIAAWQIDMLPGQRESQTGVIEIGAILVHAIVAGQAIRAECNNMWRNEIGLNNQMALRACYLVKTANILGMAIIATKGSPIHHTLVPE